MQKNAENFFESPVKSVERESRGDAVLFRIVTGSICLLVVVCFLGLWFGFRDQLTTTAPIGDSFAPLNTLFSGLAFAAVWMSLRMQREELRLQREELKDTRLELRASKEAQEKLAALAEQERRDREHPRIAIRLNSSRGSGILRIKNEGATYASKLTLRMVPELNFSKYADYFDASSSRRITELPIFVGNSFDLAPKAELVYHIGIGEMMNNPPELNFELTANWSSDDGSSYSETFRLNALANTGTVDAESDKLGEIARHLGEIARHSDRRGSELV
jgi:hypothetical protein